MWLSCEQGHLFAMEVSSGEEYYIASDNTGTPLAVFSSNGQMIKQVIYKAYLSLCVFVTIATIFGGGKIVSTSSVCIWKQFWAHRVLVLDT